MTAPAEPGGLASVGDREALNGAFVRQASRFRGWVGDAPGADHPVERRRYHLYAALACPWSHRTRSSGS
jgi:putative glutathione S-transferase